MSIVRLPPRKTYPGDPSVQWDPAWSARVYGPDKAEWRALNKKYWASRWTLFRRCLWCRAGRSKGGGPLTLNHQTYWPTKIRVGWVPLLFLVPMCNRCHGIETKLTRWLRRHHVNFGEHVVATFGGYLVLRAPIVATVFLVWHFRP